MRGLALRTSLLAVSQTNCIAQQSRLPRKENTARNTVPCQKSGACTEYSPKAKWPKYPLYTPRPRQRVRSSAASSLACVACQGFLGHGGHGVMDGPLADTLRARPGGLVSPTFSPDSRAPRTFPALLRTALRCLFLRNWPAEPRL